MLIQIFKKRNLKTLQVNAYGRREKRRQKRNESNTKNDYRRIRRITTGGGKRSMILSGKGKNRRRLLTGREL